MAFSVTGTVDGQVKNDPRYVKFMVRVFGKKDGVPHEKILDYHVCTAEELYLFGDSSRESIAPLNDFIQDEKKHLYCLDWDQLNESEVSIWGIENDNNYQRWEFALLPCNYVHTQLGDIGDSVHPECIPDHQKQMDYLGNMLVSMYVTDAAFIKDEFDEASIQYLSKFYTK